MWMILFLLVLLLGPIVAGCILFFAWRRKSGWRRVVAWVGLAMAVLWIGFDLWWGEQFSHSPL